MNRALWFVAGAASGVYSLVKAKRTAQQFTPDGIAGRAAALRAGARVFADEVSKGMQEREAELRADIRAQHERHRLIDPPPPRQLMASTAAHEHQAADQRSPFPGNPPHSREGIEDGHR